MEKKAKTNVAAYFTFLAAVTAGESKICCLQVTVFFSRNIIKHSEMSCTGYQAFSEVKQQRTHDIPDSRYLIHMYI